MDLNGVGITALQMESDSQRSEPIAEVTDNDWTQQHSDTYCNVHHSKIKGTAVALFI